MKVNCPISGISYSLVTPIKGMSVSPHPMLSSSIRTVDLVQWYIKDWATGTLAEEHVHLLGLALAQKLPLESAVFPKLNEFELTAVNKVWHANIERMVRLAGKLEGRNRAFKGLDKFRLGIETIATFPAWISDLEVRLSLSSEPISEKAKELNKSIYKVAVETSAATVASLLEPEQVENMVLRALKDSLLTNSEARALPVVLADWANKVTEFPGNIKTKWMKIIQVIFHADYINQILMSDIKVVQIKALEEHILLNTPTEAVGTSHSRLLMDRIAKVIPVIEDFSPEIVGRRKSTAGNAGVLDALLGGSDQSLSANQTSTSGLIGNSPTNGSRMYASSAGAKPMTLSEKLAARLSGKSIA